MRYFKIILFLLPAAVAMSGCSKRYPVTPPPPVPVFTFNGSVDGSAVSLAAGVNDYYMFTTYSLDANGIYDYSGEFRDKNCSSNCSNSLKISLKDYRKFATYPTTIDSAIFGGYYPYATPLGTASSFYVIFSDTIVNGTAQSYSWNFGDGATSSQHKPVHVYRHPGVYTVSLTTQTNGCLSTLINNVVLQPAGGAFQPELSEYYTGGDSIVFHITPGVNNPSKFLLDFGDGNSTTGTNPRHMYASPGVYKANLTVTDSVGNVGIANLNAGTATTTNCYNYFHTTTTQPVTNVTNLSDVTIEWHDANGTLYTSADNNQPSNSVFNILSVEDYQNNINGQPTKKIHATVSCMLYSTSRSILIIGDVVFSVAYPQ